MYNEDAVALLIWSILLLIGVLASCAREPRSFDHDDPQPQPEPVATEKPRRRRRRAQVAQPTAVNAD